MSTPRRKRRYWYRTTVYTCPTCGAERLDRERVYGKPPAKYSAKRWAHKVGYDFCIEYSNV